MTTTIRDLLADAGAAIDPTHNLLKDRLTTYINACDEAKVRVYRLGERQLETAILMAKGYSALDTARAMGTNKRTAEVARARIFELLEVDSAAQVAVLAYRAGLLGDGEE